MKIHIYIYIYIYIDIYIYIYIIRVHVPELQSCCASREANAMAGRLRGFGASGLSQFLASALVRPDSPFETSSLGQAVVECFGKGTRKREKRERECALWAGAVRLA